MQTQKSILFAALTGALVASSSATAAVSRPVDALKHDWSKLPVPTKTAEFSRMPQQFEGSTARLVMTIDETGTPRNIRAWDPLPSELTDRLIPAIAQWKFSPACDKQGKPAPIRVIIPLKLQARD
jgi:hypothetical protein